MPRLFRRSTRGWRVLSSDAAPMTTQVPQSVPPEVERTEGLQEARSPGLSTKVATICEADCTWLSVRLRTGTDGSKSYDRVTLAEVMTESLPETGL